MQALFNPHLGLLGERPGTVHTGVNWCGHEGCLGGDIIKPNLEAQESLPLSKLCGTRRRRSEPMKRRQHVNDTEITVRIIISK